MGKLTCAVRRRRFLSIGTQGRYRADTDSGTSLAEFAIVLPVLILILFGIIEFGIAFNRAQAVEAAAREGGRIASLGSSTQPTLMPESTPHWPAFRCRMQSRLIQSCPARVAWASL